jgi:hypothetical protein
MYFFKIHYHTTFQAPLGSNASVASSSTINTAAMFVLLMRVNFKLYEFYVERRIFCREYRK